MPEASDAADRDWIDTFRTRSRRDLQPLWRRDDALAPGMLAREHPWGRRHRPDWHRRGLIAWPRGGQDIRLVLRLECPPGWRGAPASQARLELRWWAEAAELRVDGACIHRGDLFDNGCRWRLPECWLRGRALDLALDLCSPVHDDGALVVSAVVIEPLEARQDPAGWLAAPRLELQLARGRALPERLRQRDPGAPEALAEVNRLLAGAHAAPAGSVRLLAHAHLDLAWLWPVADTWQAALRTVRSVLGLMDRFPELCFGQSTPALYAWLERHHPALWERIAVAAAAGRWEPLNGPWVECDCVLPGTTSLLRQFQEGQRDSLRRFPGWRHDLAWLPDSFGFSGGLPSLLPGTGVRWFCTHKLAWNADQPFPHRLFRWRGRCGGELLALMLPPIGTGGDPAAIEAERLSWRAATGLQDCLWLPGLGDHGGGPTAEMLEQLRLWDGVPEAVPQRHGPVRDLLRQLEACADQLPVWRDELYLELHRGCATSRPDQKRHSRTLERLLREAELAGALAPLDTAAERHGGEEATAAWHWLLMQQFHDILPGTSVPEVFDQAEPSWRRARSLAATARDGALHRWLASAGRPEGPEGPEHGGRGTPWWLVSLQPRPRAAATIRLPRGDWRGEEGVLPRQDAPGGGSWVQLTVPAGIAAQPLLRRPDSPLPAAAPGAAAVPVRDPLRVEPLPDGRLLVRNGFLALVSGPEGLEQLLDRRGRKVLAGPAALRRFRDQGEFWDAWDIPRDYRDHPRPLHWQGGAELAEAGPLCVRLVRRGRCGRSTLRLEMRLLANTPWLELIVTVAWRQRHELLRLEMSLARTVRRWAADAPAGVLERPAIPVTARERSRWEVPAISWLAAEGSEGGLAVLLDGPQGVSAMADDLGVSLLRGPTWPDPGADGGCQRLRVALMPTLAGWRPDGVVEAARGFREPLWCRPATGPAAPSAAAVVTALPPLPPGVVLLSLRRADRPAAASGRGELLLSLQNLTPCRRTVALGDLWQVVAETDGLGTPKPSGPGSSGDPRAGAPVLTPWSIGHWLIRAVPDGSRAAAGPVRDQSS